jgi:hypothetical protein
VEDLLTLLLALAGFAVAILVAARFGRADPAEVPGRQPLDTGPAEPCWTEEIKRDGRYLYARSQCVHDNLMELDARAARGDFPVRELNEPPG